MREDKGNLTNFILKAEMLASILNYLDAKTLITLSIACADNPKTVCDKQNRTDDYHDLRAKIRFSQRECPGAPERPVRKGDGALPPGIPRFSLGGA